jgi:hypothetical protein
VSIYKCIVEGLNLLAVVEDAELAEKLPSRVCMYLDQNGATAEGER